MDRFGHVQRWLVAVFVALSALVTPMIALPARAATTLAIDAGAQSTDRAVQVAYFFQRDVTVAEGTTVIWTFATSDPHSVNFANGTGGSGPVDSGLRATGAAPFRVTFPVAGDYTYHCDRHLVMTGVVHVRPAGTPLPSQADYDRLSTVQRAQFVAQGRRLMAQNINPGAEQVNVAASAPVNGGAIFVMRFLKSLTVAKVGDTVTFTVRDPIAPHTITLNLDYPSEPAAQVPFGLDSPLAALPGHATVRTIADQINSGWLMAKPPPTLPALLKRGTVFKMTFTAPGLYNYHCEIHDMDGMTGQILVTPN